MTRDGVANLTAHVIALLEGDVAGVHSAGFRVHFDVVLDVPAFVLIGSDERQNVELVDVFVSASNQGA